MSESPTYEEIAAVLAEHIQRHYLKDEVPLDGRKTLLTFHHNFSSEQQVTAAILCRLGILMPISDGSSHYVFACETDEYLARARANRHLGHDYKVLVLALIGMVEAGAPAEDLRKCMFELNLWELNANGRVLYTDKMKCYQKLYSQWAQLIE